jgi:hypothetical protein
MTYKKLQNTWSGLKSYDLDGKKDKSIENYSGAVTMSLPEWRNYLARGDNVLLGSGGVIPSGRQNTPWTGQAVYAGHVRQGYNV